MKIRNLAFLIAALGTWVFSPAQTLDNGQENMNADDPDSEQAVIDTDSLPLADYANPKAYILRDVLVSGVKYSDADIFAASTGLTKGDTVYIPSNYVSQALTRLWSQRYFSDVKVVAHPQADSVDLEIILQERPRVYRWLFEGIRQGEANTLTENLKLKRGSELSDYALDKNMLLIKKHFSDKGFRNVEVSPRIANDSVIKNAVNVTFVVDKKSKVKIGEINFTGNEEFKTSRLRRTMKKTHRTNINFFQSFKLDEEEYENDKDKILDFYNSKGYRNATIVNDSIYKISENRLGIDINLEEGNQYYYRNISWVGNSKYGTDQLSSILGINSGDTYDKKTLHKRLGYADEDNPEDVSTVHSLYQNDGYLMSQIDPTEIIVGEDSIDLEIRVFEGNQFTINNVSISGNNKVNDEVVRREVYTQPGELYNRNLIMRTMRQLSQMGHFDEAAITPDIQPVTGSNDAVDISWNLAEKASDKFEVSGGWGAGMFVGSVGIVLTNLSTQNFFKKNAWRPYPHGQNQQLSVRAQTNGTYYSAFSLGFTEPWLGGKKPNSLSVNAYWSEETTDYYSYYSGRVDNDQFFRAMGLSVGIGRRLNWPDQYFTLYNEFGYTAYNLRNWTYFSSDFTSGRSNIVTFKTVLGRSSVDSPIFPRRGSEFSLSLTLTPPYSLIDGKDYKNLSSKEKYKWVEYHKWLFNSKWYYPLTNDGNLILMARADLGYLGNYTKYKTSPFEGFDVGGDGMSGYNVYGVDIISLRGYEDGSLTPANGSYANVYNKYAVELRYPIIMQPQSQIFGLVFAEGGNAWMSWKEFNPFEIKRSLGAGIRMYLPVVGLLGIDWGYGFDNPWNQTKRSGGQFHFMIGQEF